MASILLALAAAVSWGVSDFMGGLFTRRLALAPVLLTTQAVGFVLLLIVAAYHGPPALDPRAVIFSMAASAAGLLGIAALYRGMSVGVVSIVAPISATGAVLPVLYGVVRGERATGLQALGILIALIGIVLASRSENNAGESARGFARGVGLAVVAALGFGLFFILIHEASTVEVLWVAAIQRLTGIGIVLLLAVVLRSSVALDWRRTPAVAVVGVLDTSANVLYALASTSGLVSIAAVLASLYPVVTVVIARVVLQERLVRIQAVGVVCALSGVVCVALR